MKMGFFKTFQSIKQEVEVLEKLKNKNHFCHLIDWGENEACNYMVMQLGGRNLRNLRKGIVKMKK